MRPAYRFALASAAMVAAGSVAWLWATRPEGRSAPSPEIPTAADVPTTPDGVGEPPGEGEAGEVKEPARPPTREEALEAIQRKEEEELGAREAAQRRRVREQMLDARARH